jgi:thiol:disulfide interchange protein DsbC
MPRAFHPLASALLAAALLSATPLAAQTAPAQTTQPAQPAQTAQAAPAQASQTAQPLSGEAAAVKKLLEQKFAGATVKGVTKSAYFGLYEVQFEDQLVYTDAKVNYILVGSVYDANTKKNLTEAKLRQLNRVAFDSLPLELSFKRVKGNGERKLAIFSDADCPFCARLEQELKNVDNVTIYTFLFPIDQLHPDAARKSKIIWCSPDKVKAWNEFFATGKLPDNDGNCDNPVAATNALGAKLKVQATPTLVFADGTIVPGALPAERLESEMTQAQAAAGPMAAAKK